MLERVWGGGSVVSTTPTVPPSVYSSGSSTTAFTPWMQFSYSGVTVTVTSAGVGLSSSTYAGCDTPDIVIWASGYNPQIWAACNIGATTSAGFATVPIQNPVTSVDAMTLPSNRVANVQGNYYQWWRNDNVTTYTFAWTGVTYTGVLSSPANTTSTTLFYGWDATYGDWKWAGAVNPAWGWNTLNTGDNTFLCASGYHIPTTDATVNSDWKKASQLIVGTISPAGVQFNTIRSTLKLPMAGVRNWAGLYSSQGLGAYYWSSSTTGGGSYYVLFWAGGGMYTNSTRVYGYTVRCIKN